MQISSQIEIIVRPECNQQCQYCYITQHGKELYPLNERQDNEINRLILDMIMQVFYTRKKLEIKDNNIELLLSFMTPRVYKALKN